MDNVLYPGDKIHLAFPISATLYPREAEEVAREEGAKLVRDYATLGVEIVLWSANSSLTCPVVVAIFRKPQAIQIGAKNE